MAYNIKPLVTETSMELAKKNWYTFGAPTELNKNQLKKTIQDTFKVDVLSIKTMVVKGKNKRSLRSRRVKKMSDWKKVLVKVKEGQKIDVFETGA